jgi:hypothetical protein
LGLAEEIDQHRIFNKDTVKGIAISAEFLTKMFEIDREYKSRSTFKVGNYPDRLLNHLTRTDILTSMILFITCNASGVIRETSIHRIHKERVEPLISMTYQEFMISIHKFEQHNLLQIISDPILGKVSIKLNHFFQPVKEGDIHPKLHRYIVLHPMVLSNAFTGLSIDAWKLYFKYIWQASYRSIVRNFPFSKNIDKDTPLIFSGLKECLHKIQ